MAESRTCPECHRADPEFQGPAGAMRLGLHRKREHGVAGSSPKTKERAGTRARARDRAPRAPASKSPSVAKDVHGLFKLVGMVLAVVDPYCGTRLIRESKPLCNELANLIAEDAGAAKVAKVLGRYGGAMGAAFVLFVPMASHHGLVNPIVVQLMGMEPPSIVQPEREPVPGEGRAGGDGGR